MRASRKVRQSLSATLAGSFVLQLSLLVSGTALARALGPEDRGHFALLTLVAGLAWQIGSLGIPFALTYSVAQAPTQAQRIVNLVRHSIATYAWAATVSGALLLLILTWDRPGYVRIGAMVVVTSIAMTTIQQCSLGVLQGLRRFTSFNALRTAPTAAFAVVIVALVLTDTDGFVVICLAWVLTLLAFLPATLRTTRHEIKREHYGTPAPSVVPATQAAILRFGRRAVLGASPPVENYRLDQMVVALFLAPASLGLYVVALAFTNLPRFIAQSVGFVASPSVASAANGADARRLMWRYFWLGIPLYLPPIAILWAFMPALTELFFGPQFEEAAPLGRLLLIASALFCARRILSDGARGAGYPTIGSVAEVVSLATAIPLFIIFSAVWGTNGVAHGLIISSGLALLTLVVGLMRATADGFGRDGPIPPTPNVSVEGHVPGS